MAAKKMRACIYSPYIPQHFGGGERYLFDVAHTLSDRYQVSIAIPNDQAVSLEPQAAIKAYESFLNISFQDITFTPSPLGTQASLREKLLWTKNFDLMYFLSDGSLFLSLAQKNILHLQIPFTDSKNNPLDRIKLVNWRVKNANSHFTQQVIEDHWRVKVPYVHYPLVQLNTNSKAKKERVILHVGRFFRNLHSKRQDVLVDAFRQLCLTFPADCKNWKLVFIGAVEDQSYLDEVRQKAEGLPIEFYHDLSRQDLEKWYAKASVYWHATGFEVNELEHPEKVEHFGISTAEAMMAGCVPIVVGKGGQLEVLGEELHSWHWQTVAEAVEKTYQVIKNPKLLSELQILAQTRAKKFDHESFSKTLWTMVEKA